MTLILLAAVERFSPEAYLTACKRAVETGDSWRVQTLVKESEGRLSEPLPSLHGEVILYAYTNNCRNIAKDLIAQCTPEQIASVPPKLLRWVAEKLDFQTAVDLVDKGVRPGDEVAGILRTLTGQHQEWMAERLLEHGMPVEPDNYDALYACVSNQAVGAAKLLLDRGIDLEQYQLWAEHRPKGDGYTETMEELAAYWSELQNSTQPEDSPMKGSWCYYFSELYEQMGLVIEDGNGFDTMLLEKLEQRPEAADVTLTDECFDVCYYLDYCKNLAPEQPAPSLSAERKEEIISGILNYMAEYFDDSSLYDILHNTLEICNDEIGCLGFALYDEYVDEQIEASEVQSDLLPKSGKLVNLLSAYEELQQIPDEERITRLAPGAFGYCLDPNVPDERLHTAYQQALSALELESDEIQEAESFTSRDEIISRMRDCLLAKELTAGDKVLFVATEPYGGPGDFDLRGGVIESVDEKDKTCSVRGTFFTMEKVPLHYVLGRYNPAVGEEHYGVRGIVPFFCEDKELAGYYLNEVRTMWDVEMGEEQDLSM